jgi:hypothetical protein
MTQTELGVAKTIASTAALENVCVLRRLPGSEVRSVGRQESACSPYLEPRNIQYSLWSTKLWCNHGRHRLCYVMCALQRYKIARG